MPIRRIAVLLLVLFVPAPVVASAAIAKSPPPGRYDCTSARQPHPQRLVVQKGNRYTYRGTSGTFVAGVKRTLKGYTIRFKGGALNGMAGHWYLMLPAPGAPATPQIALKDRGSTVEGSFTCTSIEFDTG